MSQRKGFWPFAKFYFSKNIPRKTYRTRLGRPLAAQIELLEDRTLLSTSLGTAESFAVLAGSAVTNTGPSVLNGNVGVSPGSAVTGLLPANVTPPYTIHSADAVALQAQNDLTTAYNAIASQAVTQVLTGIDLGGLTLTPGVYFYASSAQLTGTLTLDAQGNPNAEFDFQIGSTLTTASSSKVVVINGADPCKVFWQVGSSATLGTTTAFDGHILALTSITLNTGATILTGSALARNGAVTLDTNTISIGDCVAGGSISGLKFNDVNGDGIQQPGDLGLARRTVFVDLNNTGTLDPGDPSSVTDANGNFSFSNLLAGTYRVREVQVPGVLQTTPNPGPITLTAGQIVSGVTFGDFGLITISGSKFNDLNGNGSSAGKPGLPGFTIFLDANNNGVLDAGESSTVTDVNGNFSFSNVGPGTYHVREVQQTGFRQTTVNPAIIVAQSANNVAGVAFGNFQLITIRGAKFQDSNGDGIRNPGEPGLPGITIFIDANNNGVFDTGESSTVSDVNGNFSFSNLFLGTFRVREVVPANFVQMTNNPSDVVVTTSGANVPGTIFGDIPVANLFTLGKLALTGQNLSNLMDGTFGRQAHFVANLYEKVLGHAPDLAGLTYNLGLLMAGYNEQQVTHMFGSSTGHTVTDFVNLGNGLVAQLVSNGSNTQVFINEFGDVVQGNWIDPTQSSVAAWGHDLATFSAGRINWSDGSIWKQISNTHLAPTVTDYINAGNGLRAHVVANGTNSLAFINEFGDVVLGTLNNPTQATVGAWGNDVATFSNGKINWSDGSVWNLTTAAAPQVTVTNYINLSNQGAAYVVQRPGGSSLIFINEFGNIVLGSPSATQSTVAAWGNDVATFNGNTINWSDRSIWNQV